LRIEPLLLLLLLLMASLPQTGLETHPTGTAGLNDLVNSNWERVDELFDPTLDSGDASFLAFAKAFLRNALSSMVNGETIVYSGTKFSRRPPVTSLTYAATTDLPFASGLVAPVLLLALTGNVTLTTTNLFAGGRVEVVITADASSRNFTFPAGWIFVTAAAPASIAAGKKGVLTLISTGTTDAGVVAKWDVQP
jgi:hypothetical protein